MVDAGGGGDVGRREGGFGPSIAGLLVTTAHLMPRTRTREDISQAKRINERGFLDDGGSGWLVEPASLFCAISQTALVARISARK